MTYWKPNIEVASEGFRIAELAHALGATNKYDFWVHSIDEKWKVALNLTNKPGVYDDVFIEPYHFAVWHNGWLRGVYGPHGQVRIGHLEASEGSLMDALDRALGRIVNEHT